MRLLAKEESLEKLISKKAIKIVIIVILLPL
jgi:hypothetical protein